MLLSTPDILIIGLYLLGILACGLWYHTKAKNATEFMDAGRRLPGWMVGFSLFGTYISSIALLTFPSLTYKGDWAYFTKLMCLPIGGYIAARWLVGYFRKSGYISAFSHFSQTIAPWASGYAALAYILVQTIRLGLIMYLVANSLSILMGWESQWIMILTGLTVTAYTYLGGIRAVVATDVFQSILLIGGILFLLVFVYVQTPKDLAGIIEIANSKGKLALGDGAFDLSTKGFWVFLIFGIVDAIRWNSVDQACVQRYIIAKSDTSAKSAVYIHAGLNSLTAFALFALGTGLYAFYQLQPEALAAVEALPNFKPEGILPYFIATQIPVGIVGLMVVMVLAAAMSSIDTEMNATSTLVLSNIYTPLKGGHVGNREAARVLTMSSLAQGVIGIGVGLEFAKIKDVYDPLLEAISVLGGGVLGLFLLGYCFKKVSSRTAIISLVIGIVSILWVEFPEYFPKAMQYSLSPLLSNLITAACMLLSGWVLHRLEKKGE